MTHNKMLMRKGYSSCGYGTKKQMQEKGMKGKQTGFYKSYRVVPYENRYELYAKRA